QPAITALIGQPKERAMKRQSRRTLCAAGLITAALASGAFAQQQEEKLGTLSFPTSCDPKVQAEFERGVAMIHSYWFLVARRGFSRSPQAGPGLRHRLLGLCEGFARQLAGGAAVARECQCGLGCAGEGARDWREDGSRARLDRRDSRLLPRS